MRRHIVCFRKEYSLSKIDDIKNNTDPQRLRVLPLGSEYDSTPFPTEELLPQKWCNVTEVCPRVNGPHLGFLGHFWNADPAVAGALPRQSDLAWRLCRAGCNHPWPPGSHRLRTLPLSSEHDSTPVLRASAIGNHSRVRIGGGIRGRAKNEYICGNMY